MVASSVISPSASIDPSEARWAADELAGLIRRIGPDSVAGLVLRHARRELESLVPAGEEPGRVVGPLRVRVAA